MIMHFLIPNQGGGNPWLWEERLNNGRIALNEPRSSTLLEVEPPNTMMGSLIMASCASGRAHFNKL